MIRVGFNSLEKERTINQYLEKNEIKKTFVLYYKDFKTDYSLQNCEDIEYVEYADIEMYKYFYRLLEEIDDSSLIVVDECMRTQNRGELIYNCAHHYLNQTKHKIIFETFPFIENHEDFMILLDFQSKGKYKGRGFNFSYLKEEDVQIKRWTFSYSVDAIKITEKQLLAYEKEKEKLFDNLGRKHPDTIPRNLHLFVGKFKQKFILENKLYIARNQRLKLDNVATYQSYDDKERILIDIPHRHLDLNDYIKSAKLHNIRFLSSGTKVDIYYQNDLQEWLDRLEDFYVKASL